MHDDDSAAAAHSLLSPGAFAQRGSWTARDEAEFWAAVDRSFVGVSRGQHPEQPEAGPVMPPESVWLQHVEAPVMDALALFKSMREQQQQLAQGGVQGIRGMQGRAGGGQGGGAPSLAAAANADEIVVRDRRRGDEAEFEGPLMTTVTSSSSSALASPLSGNGGSLTGPLLVSVLESAELVLAILQRCFLGKLPDNTAPRDLRWSVRGFGAVLAASSAAGSGGGPSRPNVAVESLVRFADRMTVLLAKLGEFATPRTQLAPRVAVLDEMWSAAKFHRAVVLQSLEALASFSERALRHKNGLARTVSFLVESLTDRGGVQAVVSCMLAWLRRTSRQSDARDGEAANGTNPHTRAQDDTPCFCSLWDPALSPVFLSPLRSSAIESVTEAILRSEGRWHRRLLDVTLVSQLVHLSVGEADPYLLDQTVHVLTDRLLLNRQMPRSALRALVYVILRANSGRAECALPALANLTTAHICAMLAGVWSDAVFVNNSTAVHHRYISHALQFFLVADAHARSDKARGDNSGRTSGEPADAALRNRCMELVLEGVQLHIGVVDASTRRRGMRMGEALSVFLRPEFHAPPIGAPLPDKGDALLEFERDKSEDSDEDLDWCVSCTIKQTKSVVGHAEEVTIPSALEERPPMKPRGRKRGRKHVREPSPSPVDMRWYDPDFLIWEHDPITSSQPSHRSPSPAGQHGLSRDDDSDAVSSSSISDFSEGSTSGEDDEFAPLSVDPPSNAMDKRPMYLREILSALRDTKAQAGTKPVDEARGMEAALLLCEATVRARPPDLTALAMDLLSTLLHLPNLDEFVSTFELYETRGAARNPIEEARFRCMVAVVACVPECAKLLAAELWRPSAYTIQQRLDMLRVMADSARELAGFNGAPEAGLQDNSTQAGVNHPGYDGSTQSRAGSTRWRSSRLDATHSEPAVGVNAFSPHAPVFLFPLLAPDPAATQTRTRENTLLTVGGVDDVLAGRSSVVVSGRQRQKYPVWTSPRGGLDFLGVDSIVLSQLLRTVGDVVVAARGSGTLGERAARTITEFSRPLRRHADNRVRLGLLWAVSVALIPGIDNSHGESVPCLPAPLLRGDESWTSDLQDVELWLYQVAEGDPDNDCRALAMYAASKLQRARAG